MTAFAAAFCLAGCGKAAPRGSGGSVPPQGSDGLVIVTTIFPVYDWVRSILGKTADSTELIMLLDDGVDLHSYAPTAKDMLDIAGCDLFIYVGGESDKWVEDTLRSAPSEKRRDLCLMDALGDALKEEELVEGMQGEEEEEDGEEGAEYDEHVWLSLNNARYLCGSIANVLSEIDPGNSGTYAGNARTYMEQLQSLESEYEYAVGNMSYNTVLFGDRFPFRYLVDDLGLEYYAAFAGCSAETEASFETVSFLARKVDELCLPCVLTIEKSDKRLAQTIVQNTASKDQQILAMDSMQSVTAKDVESGVNYLSVMQSNLEVLKQALGVTQKQLPGDASSSLPTSHDGIDVDLTMLSSTMVYAQVYDMVTVPDNYVGKKVKMNGQFSHFHDDSSGADYYACIIMDATACCAQGIEFVPLPEEGYPGAMPSEGAELTVTGDFDTYYEGNYQYFTLRNAVVD